MKSKFFIYIILFNFIIFDNYSISEEFKLKSKMVDVYESGNLIEATGNVEILTDNNLEVKSDKSLLNKSKSYLEASGNVEVFDKKNNILIKTNFITYDKERDLIFVKDKSKTKFKNKITLNSSNLYFDRKTSKIYSDDKSTLLDLKKNEMKFDNFELDISKDIAKVNNLEFIDINKNNFFLNNAIINIGTREIFGKETQLYFDKSIFGNLENDPRIFGDQIYSSDDETVLTNAEFTSCKIRKDDKCPPWILKAKEVKHNKKKKLVEYKNAWLNIYDKPAFYFPFFYHPDPTVKRQSGFLMPKINNSNFLGSSLQIPYYNVVADNKDLTFTPRIFFNNSLLFQTEYRDVHKYSKSIYDHSIIIDEDSGSRTHFFSNYQREKDNKIEINLETTSNKNYLKKYDIKSPSIKSQSNLNSFINYENSNDNSYFSSSLEIFEDLTKKDSDSYEYIYPNYIYSKDLGKFGYGYLNFKTYGLQKKYDTNKYDGLIINDFNFETSSQISNYGFKNKYSLIIKNVNSNGENSDNYRENTDNKLLTGIMFNSMLPMIKNSGDKTQYLTPILSARYSPSETKNLSLEENRLNYVNLFNINRLNKNDMVEGGESITLGGNYQIKKNNLNLIDFSAGQVFRINENEDLPNTSSLNQTRSDIIGNLKIIPNSNFNLSYSFSADNNLDEVNYNYVETDINVNNFVTSFKFLDDKNDLTNNSFISNTSKYNVNKNNSFGFSTNKNLDINLTEYYDLIYEYKNDCFAAAVEYRKTYYKDVDLRPDENIFFTLKIIPFGNVNTPNLN